jgi:hypothetical protein
MFEVKKTKDETLFIGNWVDIFHFGEIFSKIYKEQREMISAEVIQNISEESDKYYVEIVNVLITNIDFSDAFEKAVEDKMIAEQLQLQAEYEAALAMPPGPVKSATIEYLRSQAEANEAKYPKYWYTGNTERPKHTQTSSWVGNIRYEPKSREAFITMGDKEYTYINVSPSDMARLLTSPSIGSVLAHARPNGPRTGEIVYHGF